MARYLESCGNKINGESIVIAHSNSDVADYNTRIREHFSQAMQLTAGDKMMAVLEQRCLWVVHLKRRFRVGPPGAWRAGAARGHVEAWRPRTPGESRKSRFPWRSGMWRSASKTSMDCHTLFRAKILEDLLYNKETNLSSDQNKALYLDFCIRNSDLPRKSVEFKHALKSDPYFNALRLKFGYAITCHKAQGSEWNHVFVKCKSHMSQDLITFGGSTRNTRTAARHLYLLDPSNLTPWSELSSFRTPGLLGVVAELQCSALGHS